MDLRRINRLMILTIFIGLKVNVPRLHETLLCLLVCTQPLVNINDI